MHILLYHGCTALGSKLFTGMIILGKILGLFQFLKPTNRKVRHRRKHFHHDKLVDIECFGVDSINRRYFIFTSCYVQSSV